MPTCSCSGKLNAESTIAAITEKEAAAAIVEKYLPGFAANEQAKAAYRTTIFTVSAFFARQFIWKYAN